MQSKGEQGRSGREWAREGDLSGPGMSESYVVEVQTPAKAPRFASGLRENGQTDTFILHQYFIINYYHSNVFFLLICMFYQVMKIAEKL